MAGWRLRRPCGWWWLAVSPAAPSAEERRPLVWSSTALGASDPEAGGVRLSWLGRFRQSPFVRRLILGGGDAAVACGALLAALWAWSVRDGVVLTWPYLWGHVAWAALAGVWLLLLRAASAARLAFSARDTAAVIVRAVLVGLGLYLVLYFLAPRDALPRLAILNFLTFVGIATLVWRVGYGRLFGPDTRRASGRRGGRGAGRPGHRGPVAGTGAAPEGSWGSISSRGRTATPKDGRFRNPRSSAWWPARRVSALILAPDGPMEPRRAPHRWSGRGSATSRSSRCTPCTNNCCRRLPVPPQGPRLGVRGAHRRAPRGALAVRVREAGGGRRGRRRRVRAVLLLSLPVLGPLVWLDVGWPVFFRQERLGFAGRRFRILKFRTMGPDAEPDGARWAGAEDERASRFGRFLRRSRLDELPQFWNVLRGEMSLVGPRPERPEFVAELARRIPGYRERLLVRPGLSGWAQVNYRYGGSVDGALDKLEYDLYYIKHRGFWLDAAVIWRTMWTVLALGGR